MEEKVKGAVKNGKKRIIKRERWAVIKGEKVEGVENVCMIKSMKWDKSN